MTESRNTYAIPIIGVIIIAIFAAFFTLIYPKIMESTVYMTLGDGVFQSRLAINDNERSKGLAGITKLDDDEALLMVYPDQANWSIRVQGLKIPIDIVWLNNDKKVVYIVTDASSDSSVNTTFTPKSVAKYVIELPAGTVDNKSIKLNSTATFNISDDLTVK